MTLFTERSRRVSPTYKYLQSNDSLSAIDILRRGISPFKIRRTARFAVVYDW
jgi:hypothetical protein